MDIGYQYQYVRGLLKRYGFRGLLLKTLERRQSPMRRYTSCYRRYLPTEKELLRQKGEAFAFAPLISIVVPAFETPREYLQGLLESVRAQSYPHWELCLADGSKSGRVGEAVSEIAGGDSRIRYVRLTKNGGISGNTNSGLKMARGSYIALMDHDDLLAPNALYEMVKCLNESYRKEERGAAFIYSDEDKINGNGTVHSRPHFKPDFNLEFLRRNNYICHFLMFSAELLKKTGGFFKEYDGAQDYDFVLRCVDAGAKVCHVPKILYHWRIHPGSTAGNSGDKSYAFDNGCRAIEAHLKRCGEPGKARVTENLGVYQVTYGLSGSYTLTVVAEEKEQLGKIWQHYGRQAYKGKHYQLDIHYLQAGSLDLGIGRRCIGDYILYLSKGTKVKPEGLIETLLGFCQHGKTGIVAAKLVTPKQRVSSCGVIYDNQGRLLPSCRGILSSYKGYFLHAVIPQNVSAARFGCMMVKREAFLQAGGMDMELSGIYRDADFCFKVSQLGFAVAVTPEVTAVYGGEKEEQDTERVKKMFRERWKQKLAAPDPCYNRNLSLTPNQTYAMKEQR